MINWIIILFVVGIWVSQWEMFRPTPSTPKTPEELERERLEKERRDEESRQQNLRLQQEKEARREEWRSKYNKYLRSDRWKRVRKRVLEEAGHTCAICGQRATQVHHRKYTRGHSAGPRNFLSVKSVSISW